MFESGAEIEEQIEEYTRKGWWKTKPLLDYFHEHVVPYLLTGGKTQGFCMIVRLAMPVKNTARKGIPALKGTIQGVLYEDTSLIMVSDLCRLAIGEIS